MSKLVIVKPIEVTNSMLTASNVPEADHAVWSSGTTYAVGARVILTSTHKIYESLQATNLNKDPATQPTWWIEVSPTNRWKAFDTSNSTRTVQATHISYTVSPGQVITQVNALNLVGVTSIRVRMSSSGYGTVYDKTTELPSTPPIAGWWEWFFQKRTPYSVFYALDLPSYPNPEIIIDIYGTTELAVGVIILGVPQTIGLGVQVGARIGIQDYSRKETNEYGDIILVQRAFAKKANFTMMVDNRVLDSTIEILSEVRAVPCVWIGVDEYASTVIYGFYKDFEVVISYSNFSDCSIEIEGLT